MVTLVIDPLFIPLLVLIIAEMWRLEAKISKLEQKMEDFLTKCYERRGECK